MSHSPQLPGHPFVAYKAGQLCIEGTDLTSLAQAHGTPLFVYSKAAMLSALAAYQRGFAGRNAQICYAMKANSSLGILQVFAQAGCGATYGIAPLIKREITGQIAGNVGAYGNFGGVIYLTIFSLSNGNVQTLFQTMGISALICASLCFFFLQEPKDSFAGHHAEVADQPVSD